jgi:branched-chain amino acid transport system substrate-binding protein
MDVANAPGEKILPGELGKALELLADGKDIDYVGATQR